MSMDGVLPHVYREQIRWPGAGEHLVYDLSHSLQPGMPRPGVHPPFAFSLTKLHGEVLFGDEVSSASDVFSMGSHVGTHMDAVGHVSRSGTVYGGRDVSGSQSYSHGIGVGSIEETAPVFASGHLVDLPTLYGRSLTDCDVLSARDLDDWFANRPDVQRGDSVLIRTGWDNRWPDMRSYIGPNSATPGVGVSAAEWLSSHGVAVTGCDTAGYEPMPTVSLAVHSHLLHDCGIPIIENLRLSSLAKAEVWSFFFVCVPLRISGGTGSPVRPLAIADS